MQLVTQLRKPIFLHGQDSGTQFKTIEYTNFKENTYFIKGNAKISDIAEKKTNDYY